MLNTSIGFHTITFFVRLTYRGAVRIKDGFKDFSKRTGLIKIYSTGEPQEVEMEDGTIRKIKPYYKIEFLEKYTGINEWVIRFCNYSHEFNYYSLEVTLNPKVLAGIKNCVSASTQFHFNKIEAAYNAICESISPNMPTLDYYLPKRIDYCFNLDFAETGLNCTTHQMMTLMQQSDIPKHYERKEFEYYCKKRKNRVIDKHYFYLDSDSVTMNFYEKHYQLTTEEPDNPALEASINVLRSEFQCGYSKLYYYIRRYIKPELPPTIQRGTVEYKSLVTKLLLSDGFCKFVVYNYFSRVIKCGDYYSMKAAKKRINSFKYSPQKNERLFEVLELVEQHKSISKARDSIKDKKAVGRFNRTLKALDEIRINPVTVPDWWRIKRIPNLLTAYEGMMTYLFGDTMSG